MAKDWLVTTGVRDESVLDVLQLENSSPFIALVPLFGTEGDDETFVHFKSANFFKDFYGGDEILNVSKFGQGALNGYQVLNGGGEVIAYRLTAANAKRATSLVTLHVKDEPAIPQWQREANGAFKLNASGQKIAVDDPGNAGTQLTAVGHTIKIVTTPVVGEPDSVSGAVGTAVGGWTTYPLFLFSHTAKGICGQKYGFTLENDIVRDKATTDGRRYSLNLWKKKPNGDSSVIAETVRFSMNPLAEMTPNSKISEYLENVYPKIDNSARKNRIQLKFFAANIEEVQTKLFADLPSGGVWDLDFLFGNNKYGYPYNKIVVDATSENMTSAIQYLEGGSDGSLQVGASIPDPDNVGQNLTVTSSMVTAAKKQLLIDFFNCDLNQEILDARIVDAGHVFDAGYETQVKAAMIGGLNSFRPDIHVWVDLGNVKTAAEAIAAYPTVGNAIPALTSYNFSVVGFAGQTKEARPQNVTGTYEMARKIPNAFIKHGWFIPVAGYYTGELEFMTTNFVVSITKDDMLGKFKDAAIIFPRKLSREGQISLMEEMTQYVVHTSKLKSSRNAGVIEDAQRVAIKELPKYSFDPEGAESTIKAAKEALTSVFSSRYPKNVKVSINIYQTTYDKATNNAHCQIAVTFPDVLETFTVEVVARRA